MPKKDWTGTLQSTFVTLGASNHCENEREANDYYATEPKAIDVLLSVESFAQHILEPACGEGHMSKRLEEYGYIVTSRDLIDRGYGEPGANFLASHKSWDGDIITNPPYKFAQEFVEKALEIIPCENKVAMFLKLQFLEGKKT